MKTKHILAINDISCMGRASLTVILPICSAMGIKTSVIPTAVLSTHTGGFDNYTYRDLTEDIDGIVNHWKALDYKFNAIYTGFLGSLEQLDIVYNAIEELKDEDTLVFVDPVMGDDGELYETFSCIYPEKMKKLCSLADIIVPNMTEALMLTNQKHIYGPYSKDFIDDLLKQLTELGPSKVVITGINFDNEKIGAASYDSKEQEFHYALSTRILKNYPGTGDIFASVLISFLVRGFSLSSSIDNAVDYIAKCIHRTYATSVDPRYGVEFEPLIKELVNSINLI